MPIDLCSSVNKISNYAFGSGFLNTLFGSALSIAFVIALIMILLIMIMYPAKSGTSLLIIVKLFIYMFMFGLLVVFLHDGVLKYTLQEKTEDDSNVSIMKGTTLGGRDAVYGNYNSINPTPGVYSNSSVPYTQSSAQNTSLNEDINNTEKLLSAPAVVVVKSKPNTDLYEGSIIGGSVKQTLKGTHPPQININPFDR